MDAGTVQHYYEGADELVFLDISATQEKEKPWLNWLKG